MPAPTLDQFMAKVRQDGFANPARYRVQINRSQLIFPTTVSNPNSARTSLDVCLNCEIVSIPGINILTGDRHYHGPMIKMPYGVLYTDVQMSFYCSEDQRERHFFEDWINSIIDPITRDVKFYDSYATSIDITNYDNSDNTSLKCQLTKAFPTSITPIDLGYSNTQQVMKIMVGFAYQRYIPLSRTPREIEHRQVPLTPPLRNNGAIQIPPVTVGGINIGGLNIPI